MANKKILVVDDSPTELKLITSTLEGSNYLIVTATDGVQALEKVKKEMPDLVVLDVVMPNMDGFQACRKMKASPEVKDIPIIMLTSKNQKADEFWGKKQGAEVYLTKPFADDALLEAVARCLQG